MLNPPDAPGSGQRGRVPVRSADGAGTGGRRRGAEDTSELDDMTRRFDQPGADRADLCIAMGDMPRRPTRPFPPGVEVGAVGARDACGAYGGASYFPARLAVPRQPPPQHVHPDCASARASPTPTASSPRRSYCSRRLPAQRPGRPASNPPRNHHPRAGRAGAELRPPQDRRGHSRAAGAAPKTARCIRDGEEADVRSTSPGGRSARSGW